MNNTVVLTEDISMPIDEGIKKFSFHLAKFCLSQSSNNKVFSATANNSLSSLEILPNNKLLFSPSFYKSVRNLRPERIIYVPLSSSTLMSFLRLKLLSLFFESAKTIMVSVQERKHGQIARFLIRLIKPNELITLSNKQASYYQSIGLNSKVSPIGVDTKKFTMVTSSQKGLLRKKLHLPLTGKVVLHVGHINRGRNIGVLRGLMREGFHVVVIGSTRFESDKVYKAELENQGFIFVNHYIEKIEEYYQASDIYVFPVQAAMSAMEFPLSVLEAMACNIPVVTTRFGGLESFLEESDWFRYFSTEADLVRTVEDLSKNIQCNNRNKVIEGFTWDKVFDATFKSTN